MGAFYSLRWGRLLGRAVRIEVEEPIECPLSGQSFHSFRHIGNITLLVDIQEQFKARISCLECSVKYGQLR